MTENGTTTTYTYDKNNRLLRESKPGSIITYTYDANGNLLTGDGATYTYDARNRQVGYVKGSDFATYTYYPSGLRKTKTTALAISNYIWDGSNMICEYASSAASGKVYVYGQTLISQGNVSIGFHNKSRRTFILRLLWQPNFPQCYCFYQKHRWNRVRPYLIPPLP